MEYAEWIELDNEFLSFHRQKTARIIERGEKCCYTAPDAYPAALELLEELAEYLPARYPSLFKRTEVGIDNLATGERFNIMERPLKEDPMTMAARWVQDDLAIMMEGPDGMYYLKAGATLLTGFWRLQDKLGMSLDDIHLSGDVPGFRQKLQKGMNNFFTRLQPEAPMLRNNYFIQVDGELPWSPSIGSEDSKEGEFGWFTAEKDKPIDQIYFRSERQSLRRLPKTGGVVCGPTVCFFFFFTLRDYAHVEPGLHYSHVFCADYGDREGTLCAWKTRERYQKLGR
jgi:alpha-1,2-mannosyltransferase